MTWRIENGCLIVDGSITGDLDLNGRNDLTTLPEGLCVGGKILGADHLLASRVA